MFISGAGSGCSPFEMYIMQSDLDTDKVIESLESAMANGYPSDEALSFALAENGVDPNDLTYFDKDRIKRKIEALSASYNNNRRY